MNRLQRTQLLFGKLIGARKIISLFHFDSIHQPRNSSSFPRSLRSDCKLPWLESSGLYYQLRPLAARYDATGETDFSSRFDYTLFLRNMHYWVINSRNKTLLIVVGSERNSWMTRSRKSSCTRSSCVNWSAVRFIKYLRISLMITVLFCSTTER